ncbi:MAG: PIN domain-containing protein [Chloroflexi bacterium]|nr:PIN domain-containing protein [Chloroflexota bacterium]
MDTNVILDAVDNRWRPSRDLMARIRSEGWKCSTSRFTFLEMLEVKQEDRFMRNRLDEGLTLSEIVRQRGNRRWGRLALRRGELDAIYEQLYEAVEAEYPFITFQQPQTGLWDQAEEYCAATNIGAVDSIHLATAVGVGCDVLATRDQDFRSIADGYIPAAFPENIDAALRDLGFDL